MTDATRPGKDEDSALAAEYALRIMPESEVLPFETRLSTEPELRAMVRQWSESLGGMADEFDAVDPPPRLKADVMRRVFPPAPGAERLSILRFLAGVGLGGALGLIALAAFLIVAPRAYQPGPDAGYVARLTGDDASITLALEFSLRREGLMLTELRGAPSFGTVYELWLIVGDDAPVSLGLLPGTTGSWIPVDPGLVDRFDGATLAVSEEPPGGSPEAGPTGPIRALGQISAI